jgi:hypothetical protein
VDIDQQGQWRYPYAHRTGPECQEVDRTRVQKRLAHDFFKSFAFGMFHVEEFGITGIYKKK